MFLIPRCSYTHGPGPIRVWGDITVANVENLSLARISHGFAHSVRCGGTCSLWGFTETGGILTANSTLPMWPRSPCWKQIPCQASLVSLSAAVHCTKPPRGCLLVSLLLASSVSRSTWTSGIPYDNRSCHPGGYLQSAPPFWPAVPYPLNMDSRQPHLVLWSDFLHTSWMVVLIGYCRLSQVIYP